MVIQTGEDQFVSRVYRVSGVYLPIVQGLLPTFCSSKVFNVSISTTAMIFRLVILAKLAFSPLLRIFNALVNY